MRILSIFITFALFFEMFIPIQHQPASARRQENSNLANADPAALVLLPLDEGSGSFAGDVSGSGNHGTLVNGAAWSPETADGSPFSVNFDGVNDRIDLGTLDVNGTGLTLAAWFKADTFPGPSKDPRIISKAVGVDTNQHIFMLSTISSGSNVRLRARVRVGGSAATLIASSGNLSTSQWYHAALTYDGATLRLYLDGEQVGSMPLNGAVDRAPAVPVAVGNQPAGAGDRAFDGMLDDIRILQRAMSQEELAALLAGGEPPVAAPDAYSTPEDTPLVVNAAGGVLANDTDPEGAPLTAVLAAGPANGAVGLNPNGAFQYTPNLNFYGQDSFTYQAFNGSAYSSPAAVTITVTPVNDPPTAQDDQYAALPDSTLVVGAPGGVLANDTDPDGDPLTAVLVSAPAHGTLVFQPNGAFEYTPAPGYTGQDSFTYRASDGTFLSNLAVVTLSIGWVNTPPRIVTGQISFSKQIIGTGVDETHYVGAADLNGDGWLDVVATDYNNDSIYWYENTGAGGFVRRVLDANLDGAYPAHLADLDLDGDMDVLAGGYLADTFAWYENNGAGSFVRRNIDTAANGAHSIVNGDMDGDGDQDLLTTFQDAGITAWYENDGSMNFTRRIIDTSATGAKRAEFADVDGDGDMDVVTASFDVDEIAWLENDGSQSFTKRIISTTANGAYYVFPADVDGDGDVDVFTASQFDNTIAWYENQGSAGFRKRVIDSSAFGARTVIGADIDGDGDMDAVSASVDDDTIAWYENNGSGGFTFRPIDLAADGAYGVFAIDMDGDGDMDVLSASRDADAVAIHTQIRVHQASVELGGSLLIDTAALNTVDDTDGPEELTYTLLTAPNFGSLQMGGVAVPSGGTFTQQDINANRMAYVHHGAGSSVDFFTFSVQDGGEDGIRPATGSFSISVTGVQAALVELPLDEGSGTVAGDVSGLGNHGTLVNGATWSTETADGSPFSVSFDGINDRIDLGPLDVSGAGLTLAAWLKADTFPGPSKDPRIISKAFGLDANQHIFMLSTISSGSNVRLRARVRVGGSTTTLIASSGNLAVNQWYHAALTYDGISLRLYLDSVEVGSMPLSGAVDTAPNVSVSAGNQPAGAGDRAFDGLLDDIRILQRALSQEELAAILAGGEPPVANPDSYTTLEDTSLVVNAASGVLANDTDPEGAPLTAVLAAGPAHGALSLNPDGAFQYTPNPDFSGQDSFTYRASNGRASSSPAVVTITVDPVNDPPTAHDDQYSTAPETVLVVGAAGGVLANDSDPDGDPLTAVLVSGTANGALSFNPDGSFRYTPGAGFSGQDSFTYQASDGVLTSAAANVSISIGGVLDPDALVLLPLDEGSGMVAGDVSGAGNHGLLVNGATWSAQTGDGSPFSVNFDGVDDRIDLGPLAAGGTGLTLAAWFRADTFPGPSSDPRLISKATGVDTNQHVFMLSTVSAGSTIRLRARVRIGGNTTTLIATSGNLSPNQWYHAAMTYDGAALRLFLDGQLVGSMPLSGAVDAAPSVPVAVGNQPAGAGARGFDGLLDDIRILQRALTQAELAAIAAGNR
jgi:hypothetical protein